MKQSIARHIITSHTCFSRRNTPFLLEKHSVSLGETLRSSVYLSCKQTLLTLLFLISGVVGSWGQAPVEITTAADITNNTKKLYLIQTNQVPSFYIVPQDNNTITTNNILRDYMLWYFLDAGEVGNTQYYYIVNNSTGKYVYNHNGNDRGISLVSSTDFASLSDANKEKCKFKLVVNNSDGTTDFYNINVKANQTYYGLNKQGGSETNTNPIRLTNSTYISDVNSKWKFIRFNGTYSWPDPPFTPSTDPDKHFYKIHNVQNNYYVSTDATSDNVTYASTDSKRMAWYLKEAGSDTWFKYYYIVNPAADGKYMYYSGTATNGSDQPNVVSVRAYDSTDEDRYQFVVVRTARGDKPVDKSDTRVECYAIIPKLLCEKIWGSNSIGPKGTIGDGLNLGIINSRGSSNTAQWEFVATEICANPTISFNNATNEVTIGTTTSGATIYYTTDGTTTPDPENAGGENPTQVYDSNNKPTISDPTTIKAIATKNVCYNSDVTTMEITKVATPTIVNDGANIVMSCATDGATIYYTTEATGIPSTPYDSNNPPATSENIGNTFRAIAKKDDCITSDESAALLVKALCHLPVISFNNETGYVTITKGAEDETIHYTTDGINPTASSTEYTAPFIISTTTTIKAIAIDGTSTKAPSVIATETYTQVATPVITKADNTITITCATEGAAIYYTKDGTTPTSSSSSSTSPITLTLADNVSGRTIKAYAIKSDMVKSAEATKTASETKLKLPTPTISIPDTPNENGNVQFAIGETISDEVTYYYTLDGTTTPTSTTETHCTGFFTLSAPAIIKVIATNEYYESSEVATSTSYVIPTNTSVLIQSKQSAFYYLIPNLKIGDTAYPKNLTTLNVPCNTMVWEFENAADDDGQYYYIKNSQGGYMYYTTSENSDQFVYFNADKNTSDVGYKFSITHHDSGGYNIIPKGQTLSINKPSITGDDTSRLSPVKLTGAVDDATSRWEILPYTSTESLPKWTTAPFTVSDNNNTHFYQIKSVQVSAKSLVLANDGSIKTEEVSSTDPNYDIRKSIWVAKKVGSDGDNLLDYYTFQNTYTGELLYYNGKGRGAKDNPPVLQMGTPDVEGVNETWSHFVVVQTINGYNIIPRAIVDKTKAISRVGTGNNPDGKAFNCINRAGGNDSPGTWYDNDGNSRWTFAEYMEDVQCVKPVITYHIETEKIRISTVYDNAKIYYTTDDTDPTNSSTREIFETTTELFKEIDLNTITGKVKAYVEKTGYKDSETETYTITFAAPIISYDAINDKIIITPSPGATVYYTTGETTADDPTQTETQKYTYGSTGFDLGDNINVIKAMAVKDPAVSDVVTLTIPVHAHTATKDRPYLIQSVNCADFYMIPGDVSSNVTYVNTSSLGRPSMEWYFIGAGHENEVTYFYVKNKATSEYVCYTSNSIRLHTAETFDAATDKSIYKFSISYANTATNPGYYIHPEADATLENGISKEKGNDDASACKLEDASVEAKTEARWNFVANRPAIVPPFKPWGEGGEYKYYKIKKDDSNFIIPPTKTVAYATVSNVSDPNNSMLWYFDEATHDDWVTYYYIVNAATGEYLYFNGNNTKTDNNNAIIAKGELGADEDSYKFTIAKTKDGKYYILPKVLTGLKNNNYSLVYGNGTNPLSTKATRADAKGKWTFEESDVSLICVPPVISLAADGKVTLSPRTRDAVVKYTVGSNTQQTFDNNSNPITTRSALDVVAIATETTLGGTTTEKTVTVIYKPTIVFDTDQSIVYNGKTHTPILSSVNGSTELVSHCVVTSNNINAGSANAIITQKEDETLYAIYGTKEFTIEQSPLTIAADEQTMEYGEQAPTEWTYKISGLAYTDDVTVNLDCTTEESLGSYPITFNNLVNKTVKYEIKRNNSDVSSNYKEITLIPSFLYVVPKSIGNGIVPAEHISINLTENTPTVKYTKTGGEITLTENDYTYVEAEENSRKEVIWTISGKGKYGGSAQVARIKPTFVGNGGTANPTEYIAAFNGSLDWSPTPAEWNPTSGNKKIWMVTSVNPIVGVVRVKPVNYLPKDMPVLLTSEANESIGINASPKNNETEPVSDSERGNNLLKVVPENAEDPTQGKYVHTAEVYVFYNKPDGGTGEFVLALEGWLPSGKFYIDNPNYSSAGSTNNNAPALLQISWDESTAIPEVHNEVTIKRGDSHWYSIDGRRLKGKPTAKGLYIVNGKKVIVK